ncbi:MAG: serine hydrolase [Ignavibacteriales bacterium]|nr:serine hydrolase [Ignavibacteriales bacterium]
MSSQVLNNMLQTIRNENYNIHSLLISRNDTVVFESYFYPYQKSFVHDLASVTKSITSLLIGIAIDKGFIANENLRIEQFFPEYKAYDNKFHSIQIKDLLNMTSGFECSWNDGEKELYKMMESSDWVKYMYSLPFATEPGKYFSYCSGNYYLLAEIIQRTTNMSCHEFAKKYLFEPMGIRESYWIQNKKGVNQAWGDLYLSTSDLSKIGSLIIHNGRWEGIQIVSENWLSKLTPQYAINDEEQYGLGWWFENEQPDKIEAIGRGRQRLVIYKKLKLVIVMTGGGFDSGEIDNFVLNSIAEYKKDSNNSADLRILHNQFSQPINLTTNTDDLIKYKTIDNQKYYFADNEFDLVSLSFKLKNQIPYIFLKLEDGSTEEQEIGFNNQFAFGKERFMQLPIAVRGEWINEHTLKVEYNELCRINRYYLHLSLKRIRLKCELKRMVKMI